MTNTKYDSIDIENIDFDLENPRIIKELRSISEGERADSAGPLLLLSHSDEPGPAREELEKSIIANEGIVNPIDIVPIKESANRYKVIDGNTRLALYKKLKRTNPDDTKWHFIKSCIYPDDNEQQLHDIRLLAHFMPVKQWSLYAKGQYIDHLCKTKDFNEIALKLGGKTSTIKNLQKAYNFFKEYYEDLFKNKDNAAGADESKFSHFIEAGKGSVEVALESHFGNLEEGKKTQADIVGNEDLLEDIQKGTLKFDLLVTTPEMMPKLVKFGKILGPKGLMPSPKAGTVSTQINNVINEFKKGKIEYKSDKSGIVHKIFGKSNFSEFKLKENLLFLYNSIEQSKPNGLKKKFFKTIFICNSMGPGIKLNLNKIK